MVIKSSSNTRRRNNVSLMLAQHQTNIVSYYDRYMCYIIVEHNIQQ